MLKELRQNFLKAISIPIQIIPSTGSLNGDAVETRHLGTSILAGTADSDVENALNDTGVFTEDADHYVGLIAYNTSGHLYAKVISKASDDQLILDRDAFPGGNEPFTLHKQSESESFDSALALIEIGNITGTPTSVKVKIEEDDDPAFGAAAVADGGAEVTVVQDHSYTMEIKRTKRYLRAVVTTAGGTTPTVECCVVFLLWNAQIPFPRLSAIDIDNS